MSIILQKTVKKINICTYGYLLFYLVQLLVY